MRWSVCIFLIIFVMGMASFVVSQSEFLTSNHSSTASLQNNISSEYSNNLPLEGSPQKHIAGSSSADIQIKQIELNEEGNTYDTRASRMVFTFNGKEYYVRLRRVNQDYANFIIIDPAVITSMDSLNERYGKNYDDSDEYFADQSFNLRPNQEKMIDVDSDGNQDIIILLKGITEVGEYGSIRSAEFSIKKIS